MSLNPLKTDLWNGLRGRCPHCGQGRIFRAFLKVADNCNVCGEEFHHHRADDLPAYLVIVIVGHLVVPLTLALSLLLIQPIKGMVIALQWRVGMHGFEESKKLREAGAAARV
jgi:uncharacterized protein (DUF983 family)